MDKTATCQAVSTTTERGTPTERCESSSTRMWLQCQRNLREQQKLEDRWILVKMFAGIAMVVVVSACAEVLLMLAK